MGLLQPTILAVIYVAATVGYAWTTVGWRRKGKGDAKEYDSIEVTQASLPTPKVETAQQLPYVPVSSAPTVKGNEKPRVDGHRGGRGSFLNPTRLGKLFGSKVRDSSPAITKPSTARKGFNFWRRGGASSTDKHAVVAEPRQTRSKSPAQQLTQVVEAPPTEENAAPKIAPETVERVLADSYSVFEPYVRIAISLEPDGTKRYIVVEPRLDKKERKQYKEIRDALRNGLELDVSKFKPEEAEAYLTHETLRVIKRFGIRIPKFTFDKLFYFVKRDFLHYGIIDPLMRDPNIEDISCNGPELPIFVFHRSYESIPTSVQFKTQEELEKFIMRMAYMSGRHISVSEPVVDASLPEGSRIQMTFGTEITKKGSTFTIRKFKEDPYSVIDLVKFGTLDSEIAALFWYLLENKGSVLMAGGTASGKTTTINCLALFIRPEAKIVTIEDTPEINLAHPNWIESVSRQGMSGIGEVTLYDLLRAALRQRPDFIIVGEVRGEEAYTMFQALSTGHAGMSSIHADSVAAVFHRLTNPPMNIPRTLIPAVNLVVQQARINVNGKPSRRMLSVTEVVGLDTRTSELVTNEVYKYDSTTDKFVFTGRSYILEKMAKVKGVSVEEIKTELATRSQVVQWMLAKGFRRYRDVANIVQRYYTDRPGLIAEVGAIAA